MKKRSVIYLVVIVILTFAITTVYAQESFSVNVNDENGKVTVEITKKVGNEEKVFKKTYTNKAEMENDAELKAFTKGNVNIMLPGSPDAPRMHWRMADGDDMDIFFKDLETGKMIFEGDSAKKIVIEMDAMHRKHGDKMREFHFSHPNKEFFFQFDDECMPGFPTNARSIKIDEIQADDNVPSTAKIKDNILVLNDLRFYVQPMSGEFAIKFRLSDAKPLAVKVYDMSGKNIYLEEMTQFMGVYDRDIDLSDEQAGTYILEISSGKSKLTRKITVD